VKRFARRSSLAIVIAAAMLLPAAASGIAASSDTEPGSSDSEPTASTPIITNDGTVVGPDDSITFTFKGEKPSSDRVAVPQACPEANDPPIYTVKGTPYFLPDKDKPQSSWLLPRQEVNWTVTGSHTFTWDIGAGTEFESNAIIAKAKVKIDTSISNSWTWNSTMTVKDRNDTSKGYRAVLGQQGWKLSTVKTWIAPPCNSKSKNIVTKAPRKGDMSIGRQNS
jgi:hypothetical protein